MRPRLPLAEPAMEVFAPRLNRGLFIREYAAHVHVCRGDSNRAMNGSSNGDVEDSAKFSICAEFRMNVLKILDLLLYMNSPWIVVCFTWRLSLVTRKRSSLFWLKTLKSFEMTENSSGPMET